MLQVLEPPFADWDKEEAFSSSHNTQQVESSAQGLGTQALIFPLPNHSPWILDVHKS